MKKQNGFASGIGFIMAAAGSSIGLGNLWAFPYKTYANGGAAFVLVYIACVLFIGIITMICEIFIGRRAQANPVTAFKSISPKIGWFGVLALVIPAVIACYYSVLGGFTLRFTVNSPMGNAGSFTAFAGTQWQVILYSALFIGLAVLVVMAGVKGGIEKASKLLMPILFMILVGTVVFSLCLGEGVKEGLSFYLKPDFSKLSGTGFLAAMGQAFYSLSLGMGAMITYGSYTGKKINILKCTGMICLFDTLVALLAGFAIFPALFHYADHFEATEIQGVSLMFETLPLVFEDLGVAGKIISVFFFAMVSIAAVTSIISLLEVVSQFIIQKFGVSRKKTVAFLAVVCLAFSIPIGISLGQDLNQQEGLTLFGENLLNFLDILANTVLMPVCALFGCICVGWLMGPKKALAEMKNDGQRLGFFAPVFSVMVRYVTPVLILLIEVFGAVDLIFPAKDGARHFSSNGLGIVLTAYGILTLGIAVYVFFFQKKNTGCNADEE